MLPKGQERGSLWVEHNLLWTLFKAGSFSRMHWEGSCLQTYELSETKRFSKKSAVSVYCEILNGYWGSGLALSFKYYTSGSFNLW